ncbi:MAG: alpha/beta hydrolase-fold protein [Myxococcota bacterium]
MLQGRVVASRLESKLLVGNRLGDPHARDVLVYLPPGYDESTKRYPTVTLLTGYASTHQNVLGFSPWKPNTLEAFEAQVLKGDAAPAILVLPDCMTRWGGSQFVDSAATGPYQSYLADEVFPHVDANFRTIPKREARAVAGRSSGGFGALRLGMDRPDVVCALGSHAGDAAFDISMRPMLTRAAIAIDRAGGVEAFCERMDNGGPRGGFDFDAIFVLASSAAYAPEPETPVPHCVLPFDLRTAAIDDDAWGRWLAHDPLVRIPDHAGALTQMKQIFLDAGNRDEHGLHFAARLLYDALRDVGAPVHFEEFDGGHRGTSYRYEVSLPLLVDTLAKA